MGGGLQYPDGFGVYAPKKKGAPEVAWAARTASTSGGGCALCDPESPLQLHSLWHLLTAFVLWLYGIGAVGPREQARPKIRA